MVILALFFIFPFYWLVIGTTKNVSQLFQKSLLPGIPNHFWQNVSGVFTYENGVFFNWLANSFLYAVLGAFIAIFIACMAGFAFRWLIFTVKKLLFILIFGFSMVPIYATTLPLFMLFRDLSLINTRLAVLLPSFVNVFGVYMMVLTGIRSRTRSLTRRKSMGPMIYASFSRLGCPTLSPVLLPSFCFPLSGSGIIFSCRLVVINSRVKMPVILGITTITDPQGFPVYNLTLTSSFFAILPLLILFVVLQKYFKPQLYTLH